VKSWYGGLFQLPALPEALLSAGNFQGLARAIAGSARPGTFTTADLERYRQAWSQPGALSAMLNWYRAFVRHAPRRPADTRVHLPTLMIWGAQDVALSLAMAQESAAMCDDARLVVIDDATHWVQHDAAEQVNALLRDFLKG
jgi:pimeloyl-ACP methyl ester carboxylesterase